MDFSDDTHIGQLLIRDGVISTEQLEAGLKEQARSPGPLCALLARLGMASEDRIYDALSRKLNVPYVRLANRDISAVVIQRIPAGISSHYKIIPLESSEHYLTVASSDPLDVHALDELRLMLGIEVKPVLAGPGDIAEAMRKYYGVGAETLEKIMDRGAASRAEPQERTEDLEGVSDDASIIKFVNQILAEAVKDRATDIHLEPFKDELRTRFRIDGILYDINIPETIRFFHPEIVSRIKIMAHLDIAERRLPQDGRLRIKVNGASELDLRVSTLPTAFGEAIHLRILSNRMFLQLEKLGFSAWGLEAVGRAIEKPHGIIFVTGPTGSGKSTTLYAALARINSSGIKIITIEDPIEYQMRGINQLQINPQINFTFATALRHMLRHDPDVMMVGEVRDYETAEIAIRSALTGHLVLSTLHTNDAAGAVTRLLDMGVEPFLVSSSVECLVAQRLVRLICPSCKAEVKNKQEILKVMERDIALDPGSATAFEGRGCPECRFTGFRGRTGIYEVLTVTESIRAMIMEHASSQQIKQKAIQEGMRTLRQDGFQKVISGETAFTEIVRVTQQAEIPEN